jgi:host factor-I protein
MDAQPAKEVQLPFLESLRLGWVPVAVYLVNGIRLQGAVAAFDDYTILLSGDQLVMKRVVASVLPM